MKPTSRLRRPPAPECQLRDGGSALETRAAEPGDLSEVRPDILKAVEMINVWKWRAEA